MLEILERITAGLGKEGDIEELERLGNAIKRSALCGLGQTAPNPVLSTIRHFRHEYEAHIKEKRCPAAVCGQLFKAPCTHTCPVGLDVPGYVTLVSKGRFDEAHGLIMEKNPLPGICGRVCTHPCESKCRREQIDEPISIRTIKRFVTDYMGNGGRAKKQEPKPLLNREPVAVIGAGPAGLTAAYFLALKGHPVTIYEKLPAPGGMLSYGIPEYRLPRAIIAQEIEDIKARGVEIKCGVEIGKDVTIDELFQQGFKAVFIGIGTQTSYTLGIAGEALPGVLPGLEFLRDLNLGKLNPADYQGKSAAVIGGGNTAIDAARTLLRMGAKKVFLVYRRTREEMPANGEEIDEAFKEGVVPYFLCAPQAIAGSGKVEKLVCKRCSLGDFDKSGRRRPIPVDGTEFDLKVDFVVPAIGQAAELAGIADESTGVKASRGCIGVNKWNMATDRPGVFAGGDAIGEEATVVWAMRTGAKAAMEIDKYLGGDGIMIEKIRRDAKISSIEVEMKDEIEVRERGKQDMLAYARRKESFSETELGFTKKVAVDEASRCLHCDYGKYAS